MIPRYLTKRKPRLLNSNSPSPSWRLSPKKTKTLVKKPLTKKFKGSQIKRGSTLRKPLKTKMDSSCMKKTLESIREPGSKFQTF